MCVSDSASPCRCEGTGGGRAAGPGRAGRRSEAAGAAAGPEERARSGAGPRCAVGRLAGTGERAAGRRPERAAGGEVVHLEPRGNGLLILGRSGRERRGETFWKELFCLSSLSLFIFECLNSSHTFPGKSVGAADAVFVFVSASSNSADLG